MDNVQKYTITFSGKLLPGFDLKKSVALLHSQLGLSKDQIKYITEGGKKELKKGIAIDAATETSKKFIACGLDCACEQDTIIISDEIVKNNLNINIQDDVKGKKNINNKFAKNINTLIEKYGIKFIHCPSCDKQLSFSAVLCPDCGQAITKTYKEEAAKKIVSMVEENNEKEMKRFFWIVAVAVSIYGSIREYGKTNNSLTVSE